MMPTLSKKFKTYLCFSWVWVAGLLVWFLSGSAPATTWAQSDVLLCFNNSSIPIAPTLSYTLTEGGAPVTYSVRLCTEPQILVTVTLKLDSVAQELLEVDRPYILFDQTDWKTPEPVKVSAKENNTVNSTPQVASIGHPSMSQDSNYNHPEVERPQVQFIILDNESPSNEPRSYLPMIRKDNTPTPSPTPTPTSTPIRLAEWTQLASSPSDVEVVAIHKGFLFAGDRSSDSNKQGIYRSATSCEGAVTFNHVRTNIPVEDLSFSDQFGIAASNGDRVYYSSNDSSNWQRTNSTMNRFAFAVAIINNGLAYAGTDDGVYQSSDKGVKWDKGNLSNNGPRLINAFTYAQQDNILWIGTYGGGVWKLTPGGTQFTQLIGGLTNPDSDRRVWDILRRSNSELYIATTNGVYTGNGTDIWRPFGLTGLQVLSLELIDNTLYAGVREGGVWRTPLGGAEDWKQESGITPSLTVRDLLYDQNALCNDPATGRRALLAGTTNGIWIYR
jgi:hypothetical protein